MKSVCDKNITQFKSLGLPSYTPIEEIMNAVTHGFGVVFSLVAIPILLTKYPHNLKNMLAISLYGATLFCLYIVSTLYHSLKAENAKAVLRKLDHCSIFFLIAGTYTPICTLCIKEPIALIVLAGTWVIAIIGTVLNAIDVNKFSKFSLTCYMVMGWSVVLIAKPIMRNLTSYQLNMLIIGGIFYTVGAALYVVGKKIRYIHSVWHVFVLAGSVFHFLMLY